MSSGFDQMSSWSRDVRFASGCILMVFATTHFLNHALGIFGIAAMEEAQGWRYWFWHSWVGTVALYGSFTQNGSGPGFYADALAGYRTLLFYP